MMRRALLVVVALVAPLLPASAGPTPIPLIGPQFDAVALRAARGAAPGPVLELGFELRHGNAAPVTLTLTLGPDWFDLQEGGRETLYDFQLRRRIVIDRVASSFSNLSLYGDVAFRRFEMEKRVALSQAYVQAVGSEDLPRTLQPFWIESEVKLPSSAAPPKLATEKLPSGATRFKSESEEVALLDPTEIAMPDAARASFIKFLRVRLPLHPAIIEAIAADGHVPQRIVFVSIAGDEKRPLGLVLRSAETRSADYPVPAGFAAVPVPATARDVDATALRALMPSMLAAVGGSWGSGPKLLADYRRAIDAALKGKERFKAALLVAEATLQYGRAAGDCRSTPASVPCYGAEALSRSLAADPRAASLFKAQSLSAKDPKEAVLLWRGLKRDDVANSYVIDAFLANLLSSGNYRREAAGEFDKAMRGNPYLGALYKDLGDHYLRADRVDLAWICYDLGRALPYRPDIGPLITVDQLEQKLLTAYAEFF
jgi:hypothetical protein